MASVFTPTERTAGVTGSVFGRQKKQKQDLSEIETLQQLAAQAGAAAQERGQRITGEKETLLGSLKGTLKTGLMKTFDILQRPNFAIASSIKNVIDDEAETTFLEGLSSGFRGETKHTFTDVLADAGVNPETKIGKFGKGAAGFALDVLLDPTTYLTFGSGAGVKVGVKGGAKVLTREGAELLAKGVAQKSGQEFGEDFVKRAIVNMAEKSPELHKKFIDQGGIKFFGNTIVSGARIGALLKTLPLVQRMDDATGPIRSSLHALVDRNVSAKFGRLPKEFTDIRQKYLDIGKVRSEDAVNEVIDIARANNLTTQEAEIISNAIENKLHLADDRLENARKQFQTILGRNLKDEQAQGIKIGELPNYVPHMLVDTEVKTLPFKPVGVRVALGATKSRKIEGAIQEINEAFGKDFFDANIMNTVAIRATASSRAVTSAEFLNEVGRKFGTKSNVAPSGYVKVGAKELDGLSFHPAIAEQIDGFQKAFIGDEATGALLRQYDKLQNLWKASVTSIFPAFHGRNAISNVFLNFLDIGKGALSPAKNGLAGVLIHRNKTYGRLLQKSRGTGQVAKAAERALRDMEGQKILKDINGRQWTFGELREEIRNNRVAFGEEFTGFLDIREGIAEKLGRVSDGRVKKTAKAINPFSQRNVAFRAGRAVGNVIEEQARLVNFLTNLEKTGDVLTAAQRTKQFLFDYQNLSGFERNVLRRMVPFYTFMRKNLELQATQLAKQPGKFATQAKIVTNMSKLISGATLTDEEAKDLPEFLQEGLGIIVSKDGEELEMISRFGLPVEAAFDVVKGNALLGALSPIINVPLQVATERHFFFDRPLDEVNDAKPYQNAPQFLKDYIGYTTKKNKDGTTRHVALNPTRLFLINNIPPSSRVIAVVGQLEEENVSGKLKLLRQLTGLKPYAADLERTREFREKKIRREMEDLLEDAGVGFTFERFFIPKDKKKKGSVFSSP